MKALEHLPDGYHELYAINLQKNKKASLLVNLFSIFIAIVLIVPMHFVIPISTLFSMEEGLKIYILRYAALIVLMILYIVLHELVHGFAMKICGTKKVKYGFTGIYAFAGSTDFYDKKSYIFIALAPVILWGIVLAAVNPFVPAAWFWVVYFIQILNLSGAAGDFFVTVKFLRFPKDILIKDCGVGMTVFSKETK